MKGRATYFVLPSPLQRGAALRIDYSVMVDQYASLSNR